MLGELCPRVLHVVSAPSGSIAEGLAGVGRGRTEPQEPDSLGLHPFSVILGKTQTIMALPHGVVTRIK